MEKTENIDKIGSIFRKNMQAQLKQRLADSGNAFLMSYAGVKSSDMSDLRKELKQLGAKVFVTRNTLAKISLKEIKLEGVSDFVEGPLAFIYFKSESSIIAKALVKFSKTHESVKLKGGFLKKEILDANKFKELASLPSQEILYAMLLGTLNAPLNNLVFILSQKISELLSLLKEIGRKKSPDASGGSG